VQTYNIERGSNEKSGGATERMNGVGKIVKREAKIVG
jgi:hypothetical protein